MQSNNQTVLFKNIPVMYLWYGKQVPEDNLINLTELDYPFVFLKNLTTNKNPNPQLIDLQEQNLNILEPLYKYGGVYSDFENKINYQCLMDVLRPYQNQDKIIYEGDFTNSTLKRQVSNSLIYSPQANLPSLKNLLDKIKEKKQQNSEQFTSLYSLTNFPQLVEINMGRCVQHPNHNPQPQNQNQQQKSKSNNQQKVDEKPIKKVDEKQIKIDEIKKVKKADLAGRYSQLLVEFKRVSQIFKKFFTRMKTMISNTQRQSDQIKAKIQSLKEQEIREKQQQQQTDLQKQQTQNQRIRLLRAKRRNRKPKKPVKKPNAKPIVKPTPEQKLTNIQNVLKRSILIQKNQNIFMLGQIKSQSWTKEKQAMNNYIKSLEEHNSLMKKDTDIIYASIGGLAIIMLVIVLGFAYILIKKKLSSAPKSTFKMQDSLRQVTSLKQSDKDLGV